MSHNRKLALVTGGARGIGLGISQALAASGFDLAINGRRTQAEVQPTLTALEQLGARVLYLQADIAHRPDHARILDTLHQQFGRLDLLVNNAGVAPDVRADILDASEQSFDRLISINLKGPYFLTQAAARYMIQQRSSLEPDWRGRIINISSISVTHASVNRGDYCITKAGIAMATQLWATRLAEFNIDVYEVRPGVIATDMTAGVKEKYDALFAGGFALEKRWGTPDDVGRATAALARGDIPYATGQILNIDGGASVPRL